MKLHFYGADRCVTGSCHCLEINGKKILVDCGLQQGRDELDNRYLAFAPGNIDILLVTHAHIDHTGRIPLLVKNGFHGRILTTRLTADLMKIMLLDSAHIQESDAEYENRKGERAGREHVDPLYTEQDALDVFKYVTTCEYKEKVDLCEGVSAVFTDAGHLLGSASITLELEENGVHKTIVFSGDIGNVDQPIIRDPQLLKKADYVVMESTYGDRNHTEVWSYTDDLAKIIDETSDLSVYETNMNLLYDALTSIGFDVVRPGGTFYIFPKALEADANAFCMKAKEYDLILVPSDSFGVSGYFRMAYCIDTDKVKRSIPVLERFAREEYGL